MPQKVALATDQGGNCYIYCDFSTKQLKNLMKSAILNNAVFSEERNLYRGVGMKRFFDFICSLLAIILLSPVLLLLSMVILIR